MKYKQSRFNESVIEEKNVYGEIVSIKQDDYSKEILLLGIKLLTGEHKGCQLIDKFSCTNGNSLAWKYLHLRACLGNPYKNNEPEEVDLDELFIGKVILMDLTSFNYEDRYGMNRKKQKFIYKNTPQDVKIEKTDEEDPFLPF